LEKAFFSGRQEIRKRADSSGFHFNGIIAGQKNASQLCEVGESSTDSGKIGMTSE